ncbi:MAG: Smr/MutS family protein [Pikeienuella sp.]|uniref:Smr/MutS family protein n=1 Tax=Pikeienuella sp. TaxID=2831957 RepID=UPI00391D9F24
MSRRGRRPTAEERALWDAVAGAWNRRAETAPPPAPPKPVSLARPPSATEETAEAPRAAPVILRPQGRSEPPVSLPRPRPAPPSGLDRATEARLRKGRRAPDARIDLHGMTALAAHRALSAFLFESRAAGRRCVLVITGKGGFGEGAPGVLRRETPFWLETPPLSEIVVNVTPAHPRHGGGGALYVYLKRAR